MKTFKIIMYVICILFLVWISISYLDICAHNLSGKSDASWNLFNIMLGGK